MKVTENSTYRLMQTNLDRITNDLAELRNQGATGLILNKPSDDPGAIRPVLTTRSQLMQNDRYLETMGQAGDKMAAADGQLAQVENVMVRAKEITINAINGALSTTDLATLADEIAQLRQQLLDSANAVVDGKYIFAGYMEDTKPFSENPAYDPALYDINDVTTWPYLYHGDNNPTRLEITPGEFLTTNLTGNELFMGITNAIASNGSTNPYQGESMTSGPISVGTPGDDITITTAATPPVVTTIPGTALTDTDNNYAAKVAGLFSQAGTGLIGTTNAASVNLGSLALNDFVDTEDTYSLDITAGGAAVSVTLDGPSGNYDFTLAGMASALANTAGVTNLTQTSGTLSNGVSYDISSGALVLTGPANGSEIELNETITDGVVTATLPTGGISGGDQTAYGTINVAPNSSTGVTLSGTGLADVGLTADTLNGASGRIDLFTILTRTEEAIRAGNFSDINGPGGSLAVQLENLEIGANQNRTLRSSLGARATRVESALLQREDAQIDLKQILSRYQDADIIKVYNDIIQKENAFEAALNVTGRVSRISILDYF
ncbi:MAG: flagellar hook-associated protein FlgL [Desulforhopalus sp.]|nr:flagellar hook-associated protein FlgL [Desulforhopalus sp.]